MLRAAEIWTQMKEASEKPTDLDKYDNHFHFHTYRSYKKGEISKEDILEYILQRKYVAGKDKGKTVIQEYF